MITWVWKNSWKMFHSEFPQSYGINPCLRTKICNSGEKMNVPVDILNTGSNVEKQEDCGITGLFFKKSPIIIDDSTKNKFMKMKRTLMLNIYK